MGKSIIYFKRWTNKRYASFASMKAEVRICVLSLGCSLLTLPGAATYAQVDSTRNIRLTEVEVTAQKQQLHADLARVVTVMTKEEIATAPAATIAELLRFLSGVDIRQRGVNGVQSDVSMRGGSFDQMLVLLNGINISDPQTGHYSLDIPVDISSIDRIEILQGPASRTLGPNAFSGAINIITGTSEKSSATLSYTGGDHGLTAPSASGTLALDKAKLFGAVSYNRSDGYAANTDYDILNAFGQVRVNTKATGDMNFQAGFQNKGYGALQFYSLKYPDQYEHTTSMNASLSSRYKFGHFAFEPKIYWREHLDKFELFRYPSQEAAWYKNANFHQTDVGGVDLSASYFTSWGRTQAGASYRLEHIFSNVLGNSIQPRDVWFSTEKVKGTGDEVAFDHEKYRHNWNFFLEQSVSWRTLTASAGAALNYSNDFGANWTFGGDVSYGFARHFSAFASVNQALRLPTFTDLYYKSADHLPNSSLSPEKSLTAEAGLKVNNAPWLKGRVSGALSVFYRNGRDIIDWVKLPSDDVWRSMNHTEINAIGTSLWAEYASGGFVRNVRLSYDFIDLDKQSDGYLSQYALDYLKHKAVLSLRHNIAGTQRGAYGTFEASWLLSYNDREGTYTNAKAETLEYDPFFLLNLRLSWTKDFDSHVKRICLFAEADNLLDTSYYDYGGIRQPGIWAKGGFAVKF
ncbi:MAG: TonB-dependent receptor [Bacteroidales bacterium]|jgi:iron complex outermembrane receptor protein|nr:TonB-dependent receptor [Bacteroidales bacterium]